MDAWEDVPESEYASLWNDSTRQFEHLPPLEETRNWPDLKALAPSITYKLQGWASMDPHLANRWAVGVMRACQPIGKRILVLDWDQAPLWLDVHHPDALGEWEGSRWLLSLGEYTVFLSRELESGMFCSPAGWTLSIFGEPFLRESRSNPPPFVDGILREDGASP